MGEDFLGRKKGKPVDKYWTTFNLSLAEQSCDGALGNTMVRHLDESGLPIKTDITEHRNTMFFSSRFIGRLSDTRLVIRKFGQDSVARNVVVFVFLFSPDGVEANASSIWFSLDSGEWQQRIGTSVLHLQV